MSDSDKSCVESKMLPEVIETPTIALPREISIDDIENLDTEKLRDHMLKQIYVLEHYLFSQAGHESVMIASTRAAIKTLQEDLLNPDNMAMMTKQQKILLFRQLSNNLNNSLRTLQYLHRDTASGLDTVRSLDKHSNVKKTSYNKESDDQTVSAVKKLIQKKIREKSVEK